MNNLDIKGSTGGKPHCWMPLNHSLPLSKEIGLLFDQCLEIIETCLFQTLCLVQHLSISPSPNLN